MKSCPNCKSTYPTHFTVCPRDAAHLEDMSELAPGSVLRGKYKILEKIGEGGMGAVYKAMHLRFDEECALKVVLAGLLDDPSFLQRFHAEALLMRKLDTLRAAPVMETLRTEGWTVVSGAFVPLASFALFHMVTVFPLSWVFLFTREAPARFLLIEAAGALIGVGAIVLSGFVADQVGRATLLGACAVAIAAFSGFAPQLPSGNQQAPRNRLRRCRHCGMRFTIVMRLYARPQLPPLDTSAR